MAGVPETNQTGWLFSLMKGPPGGWTGADGRMMRSWIGTGLGLGLGLGLAALLAPAPGALAADGPGGIWMKPGGKAAVEFFPCEETRLCARLIWARPSEYPQGQTRDINNPDPDLRRRDLCGATIIWGLEPDGEGGWEDGWVYDPSTGKTYGAEITRLGPQRLKVRGYKWVSLLGKTQVWEPAPQDLDLCTEPLPDTRTAER